MSYQAIARKWRPTTFDEIAGQTHVTRTLKNAIELKRVHHAFLFSGPRGVGKTSAARALARALNCKDGPTPTPCGECPSCIEILSGSSPDVIEIDGASNNSVDDIRDLRDSVRYMPVHGRSKVYIVDEVHMLSKGAFNALLKTLEEPPPHVVFMFATTEPQRIPDTILSRVQRFDFKRIPIDVVVGRLRQICDAESVEFSDDGLRLIARAGEGSMRDAQSLLDQVISFAGSAPTLEQVADILGLVDRGLLYQMLEGLIRGDAEACLSAIASVYGYGYELSEFTGEMLVLLRNATMVGLSDASKKYLDVPEDERTRLETLVNEVSTDVLVRAFQVMLDVHDQVARASRPRLVLEMAVARLVSIRPAQPIDRIVHRLQDLEQRIREGGGAVQAPSRPAARPRAPQVDDDQEPSPAAEAVASAPLPPELKPEPVTEPAPLQAAEPTPDPGPEPTPTEKPESAQEAAPASESVPTEDEAAAEDGEEDAADRAPESLPETATSAERFAAFGAWLVEGGVRYEVWFQDSVLDHIAPPAVHVQFPSAFKCRQAEMLGKDPRVVQAIEAFFPGCTRAEVSLRAEEQDTPTHREEVAQAEVEAQSDLEARVKAEPRVQQICEALDATVSRVDADHHAPVPPVLAPPVDA